MDKFEERLISNLEELHQRVEGLRITGHDLQELREILKGIIECQIASVS